MNAHHCQCHEARQGPPSSWAGAFASLVTPAVRLHQLRNMRSRMLRGALEQVDGCSSRKKAYGDGR